MRTNASSSASQGFALLIALSLMAFVLLLLLSVTTLLRVETRGSEMQLKRLQAEENAKLGLLIAWGELQKLAGPDQAVSAQAAILDTDGSTPEVEGVQHPFWTGIWDVSGGTGSTVAKDFTYASSYAEWAKTFRESRQANAAWLVSGNEGKTPSDPGYVTPLSALTNPVTLYGSPGASDADGTPVQVSVPQQEVSGRSGNADGSYAYWVGDEGVKAKVTLSDPFKDETDERAEFRSLSPPNLALPVFDAFPRADVDVTDSGDLALLRKMQGTGDLGLVSANADKADLEKVGHAVTAHSQGVVADVRFGGLKKDLSAAFSDDDEFERLLAFSQNYHSEKSGYTDSVGQIFPTQSDTNAEDFNPLKDPGGPLWSQLRSHFNLAGTSPLELEVRPQTDEQVGISPVVVSAQLYFAPTSNPDPNKLNFHLLPAVVLWNPYNVDLRSSEGYTLAFGKIGDEWFGLGHMKRPHTADIPGRSHMIGMFRIGAGYIDGRPYGTSLRIPVNPERVPSLAAQMPTDIEKRHATFVFTIPPDVTIAAGEAVAFSPPEGYAPFDISKPENNRLEPGFRSDTGSYYYEIEGFEDLTDPSDARFYQVRDGSRSFTLYQGNLDDYSRYVGLAIQTISSLPILQQIRELNFMVGRRPYQNDQPSIDLTSLSENEITLLHDGYEMRLLTAENNNPMVPRSPERYDIVNLKPKWLANLNPRALYSGPSKYDAMAEFWYPSPELKFRGSGDGEGLGMSNPSYDVNRQSSDPAFFNEVSARVGEEIDAAILFEIPPSAQHLQSIGQLMHANLYKVEVPGEEDNFTNLMHYQLERRVLSPYGRYANLNPAYPIGNSLADPKIKLDMTYVDWEDFVLGAGRRTTSHYIKGFHYDYSYLLNDVLWDTFFLSSLSASDWTATGFLPNQRLNLRDTITTTELFDTAASNVSIDGAFNVNSVSIEAWAAFIGGFLGVDPEDDSEAAFYSRLIRPMGDRADVDAANPETDPNTYSGYRTLSIEKLRALATAVVEEVKERGPFLSMSDFVNRRLTDENSDPDSDPDSDPVNQLRGALQEAIDRSGVNGQLEPPPLPDDPPPLPDEPAHPLRSEPDQYGGAEVLNDRPIYDAEKTSRASAVTAHLTQADLLARLGSVTQVRSDTFLIRSYGSSKSPVSGASEAEVWCEALVQRVPEFVDTTDPAETAVDDLTRPDNINFGRRFKLVGFRWLNQDEI